MKNTPPDDWLKAAQERVARLTTRRRRGGPYVLGRFEWSDGALLLLMMPGRQTWWKMTGEPLLKPLPDADLTTDARQAMKWRNRQAAAKYRDYRPMSGYKKDLSALVVFNLAELGYEGED